MTTTTTTRISIERIATGTVIEIPGFGAAEVYECDFDGSGYSVTYCTNDRYGWDCIDHTYFDAGTMVEAYDYQTFLRSDASISFEEWQSKNAAALDGLDASLAVVARPIDERPLVAAVADALGVPALSEVA